MHAPNPQLVEALVRAHIWVKSLANGAYDSVEDLARAADLHPKVIRNRMRLAFLAPNLVDDILQGRQVRSVTIRGLVKSAVLSWREQRRPLQSGA
jgi:hypothetical protein